MSYLAHNYAPIRVALVGCGRWGSCLAETLTSMPEFELAWVCDPAVRWPGSRWAPLVTEDVCRDVDAVLVATPAGEHLAPTLMALQSRKPVLVEKPFVQSLAEVRQIRDARGETLVMVGHLLMYHPAYRTLSEQVARLHAVSPITLDVIRHSPPRGTESRCPWWTMAPHDLALLTNMFGTPLSLQVQRQGQQVRANLSWQGAQATLEYSTMAAAKTRRWRIQGHDGETSFDEQTRTMSWSQGPRSMLFQAANPLREELRHFAHCVHSGTTPLTGLEEAKQSVRLLCWGDRHLRAAQSRPLIARPHSSAFDNP